MDMLQYPFDGALILQKKRALKKELLQKPGLVEKRVALFSGSTIGEIKNILELFLLELGIRPVFYEGEYGLFYENLLFDGGAVAAFQPEVVYIHTSNRNLKNWPTPADTADDAAARLATEYTRLEAAWKAALTFGCPVVANNFEDPSFRNFGNLDASHAAGRVSFIRRLNAKMADFAAATPNFYIHDLAWLAAMHGVDAWCDTRAWYAYKYCCAVECIPTLAHSLAALIGSFYGRGKKCVVTDLDNTLWGGVIGEVGAEGVELGDETPAGMAYADFARYLKALKSRGVMLAAASKNEESTAKTGFARAGNPLSSDDFLLFEANWGPKSQSIEKIASTLNILPESIVFTDDNPAERAEVCGVLPGVTAPPVAEPEDSILLLDRSGLFETSSLSADDLARNTMYKQNVERAAAETGAVSYEDYLLGLGMTAEIGPFRPAQMERVTQLINKTNQFNLTTLRCTAAEVEAFAADTAGHITLAARLTDRFGDNGLTSGVEGRMENTGTLAIDIWLMSCRVFKRHFEYAMFDALVEEAQKRGVKKIAGTWRKTAKNLLVEQFYATIGFDETGASTADERHFEYKVPAVYAPLNKVIKVTKVVF